MTRISEARLAQGLRRVSQVEEGDNGWLLASNVNHIWILILVETVADGSVRDFVDINRHIFVDGGRYKLVVLALGSDRVVVICTATR